MLVAKIIFYLSVVAWFFPLFRQYKHDYFCYFLILALTDPVCYLMTILFKFNVERGLFVAALLMAFSFTDFYKKHFYLYSSIIFVCGSIILSFIHLSDYVAKFLTLILLLIIVYIVLKLVVMDSMKEKALSIFYLVLFVYVLSLALKFYIELTRIVDSVTYFYITTLFEILAAIFFSFYNEVNSKRIKLET
jgi:hypothetical protein